ncbi:hypothetical protein K1719_005581 [Acacia pycnantha]|nr:hypothetical protein K1719_005581 [Acacia pycnantha]
MVFIFRFLDSETNSTASFSCRFTFSIVSSPSSHSSDGIAFMIISDTDLVSFSSGYMDLPSISVNEQDSYFAVEFDTNPSEEWEKNYCLD